MGINVEVLDGIPYFGTVSAQEKADIARDLDWREYKKGDILMEDGADPDGLYYILSGKVKFYHVNKKTEAEFKFGEAGKGHFFGEVAAVDGGPRTATVEAIQKTEVLIIRKTGNVLKEFLKQHPALAMALLDEAVKRLRSSAASFKDTPILNSNQIVKKEESTSDRITHYIARFFGSWPFLVLNALLIWWWMQKVNGDWSKPEFTLLAFLISAEALFFAMVVLNSQNRQARAEELSNDNEFKMNHEAYSMNEKAYNKIMDMDVKLNTLINPQPAISNTQAEAAIPDTRPVQGQYTPSQIQPAQSESQQIQNQR